MLSVFEFVGWKTQTNYTSIPQLGISNRLNSLQRNSEHYFTLGENAQAADGDILAVSIKSGQHFDLNNAAHLAHLKDCVALFKDKGQALANLDKKIVLSSLMGIVASSLSFLPFVGYLSLLGWGSTIYHLSQRKIVETEYKEALNLLVVSCNWSLGGGSSMRKSSPEALTANEEIREMMACLYPVLTVRQAKHLIADDIEHRFIDELQQYEAKYHPSALSANASSFFVNGRTQDERIAQSKRGTEFNRCIYGYQKGNYNDYLDAFFSIIPDIYNLIHYGCKRLQHWWNSDNKKDSQEQAPVSLTN